MNSIGNPYSLHEFLGLIKRRYLGPTDHKNSIGMYAPQSFTLHSPIEKTCKVAFIGDILSMGKKNLRIGTELKTYIEGCDYLVGNFESTITDAKGPVKAPRHIPQIVDALADLFAPEKTFLSMANNHTGDFGQAIWSDSKARLVERGFQIFGTTEVPYVDLGKTIRIIAATQWSNQPCDYITKLNQVSEYLASDKCNLLYVHWGYELELSPRAEIMHTATRLLADFDAIVGHHSHTPQPIVEAGNPVNPHSKKLLAYGLGNFCAGGNKAFNWYGQVIIITSGATPGGGRCQLGDVDWRYLLTRRISDTDFETELTQEMPRPADLRPEQLKITLRKIGLLR